MLPAPKPFTSLDWTPDLVDALAEASGALARLDARILVSPVKRAWGLRASWTGYAQALKLQRFEIDEIDVYAWGCGLRLSARKIADTRIDPFADFDCWRKRLAEPHGSHWREDLSFTFDPPQGWEAAPQLIRALGLLDIWCHHDPSIAPWLGFPIVLRRLGLTTPPLPCLVIGDPAQRFARDARPAQLKRLLKRVNAAADEGLVRLNLLEAFRGRAAVAIAAERRPGKLAQFGALCLTRPALAARSVAPALSITVSGAGKLLVRAADLGLLVETSGLHSWRSYVTHDIAVALGMAPPERGRPRDYARPNGSVAELFEQFDRAMADAEILS